MRERFGGATISSKYEPMFTGHYRSATGWVEDTIVRLIADTTEDMAVLEAELQVLEKTLAGLYLAAGSARDEFWITVSEVLGLRIVLRFSVFAHLCL